MEEILDANFFTEGLVMLADASGDSPFVCIAKDGKVLCEIVEIGGTLENIFDMIRRALASCGAEISDFKAFCFCRGTGSILSIRILSAAFASFRAMNPNAVCVTWNLLDVYAEILRMEEGETFSIVCPSRKQYANAISRADGLISKAEILSEKISNLPKPIMHIRQKKITDKNFEGLSEIYFSPTKIFEFLKLKTRFAYLLEAGEIADALVLAKREYVKWNSQAHS